MEWVDELDNRRPLCPIGLVALARIVPG